MCDWSARLPRGREIHTTRGALGGLHFAGGAQLRNQRILDFVLRVALRIVPLDACEPRRPRGRRPPCRGLSRSPCVHVSRGFRRPTRQPFVAQRAVGQGRRRPRRTPWRGGEPRRRAAAGRSTRCAVLAQGQPSELLPMTTNDLDAFFYCPFPHTLHIGSNPLGCKKQGFAAHFSARLRHTSRARQSGGLGLGLGWCLVAVQGRIPRERLAHAKARVPARSTSSASR